MLIKITFSIILLILSTGITCAQFFESVEKEAEKIIISLSDGDTLYSSEFSDMKNLLNSYVEKNTSEINLDVSQRSIDSLKQHLNEIGIEKANVSADSALTLFVDWYLHFQGTFYSYSKLNFFDSPKTKILFFSTSMSCHCTLEMCKKQVVEILKLKKETGDSYSFLVVDSYWNNDLQLKYETYFAPSVLVFNQSNELILKIEYEEGMIEQLIAFLSGRDKI